MELINRMRKNRKGFTLVEIIVVLVILAILAAFTIPTMLGFVNDAKGKSYIAEAREVYVAAQATSTEMTAKGGLTYSELQSALASSAVLAEKTRQAAVAAGTALTFTDAERASSQMLTYINTDLNPVATQAETKSATQIKSGNAHWTITLGTTTTPSGGAAAVTTDQAKVTSLVYSKGGYEVTIKDGNASVVKLK